MCTCALYYSISGVIQRLFSSIIILAVVCYHPQLKHFGCHSLVSFLLRYFWNMIFIASIALSPCISVFLQCGFNKLRHYCRGKFRGTNSLKNIYKRVRERLQRAMRDLSNEQPCFWFYSHYIDSQTNLAFYGFNIS